MEMRPSSQGLFFYFFLAPRNGKADDNAAEHSQNQGGVGVSHPRTIFVENVVQAVVELAFDAPVVPLALLASRLVMRRTVSLLFLSLRMTIRVTAAI